MSFLFATALGKLSALLVGGLFKISIFANLFYDPFSLALANKTTNQLLCRLVPARDNCNV
jgi:hypothetical protein